MSFKNLFRCFSVLTFTFSFIIFASAQTATAYLTEPAFSPDRKEIVFVSGGDIWTVSANRRHGIPARFASGDRIAPAVFAGREKAGLYFKPHGRRRYLRFGFCDERFAAHHV